jgi:hypothetical protein
MENWSLLQTIEFVDFSLKWNVRYKVKNIFCSFRALFSAVYEWLWFCKRIVHFFYSLELSNDHATGICIKGHRKRLEIR